jgi:hypothetical protein
LNLPGLSPIELNVDFKQEIEPHLGRLLGKGGYGHVYEAVWRGEKVRDGGFTVVTPLIAESKREWYCIVC